jgi:hypothetical protein
VGVKQKAQTAALDMKAVTEFTLSKDFTHWERQKWMCA